MWLKMTKPERLDLKRLRNDISLYVDSLMIDDTLRKIKDHIKSACEFYIRYLDNPELFCEEQFKIKWDYFPDTGFLIEKKMAVEEYNDWLFRLAFQDVINDV